jgi:hypothetical protein
MHPSSATFIEIGMVVAGALGLIILVAPTFGLKPRQTAEGWQFPVKLSCLLAYCLGFAGGLGAVLFGARQLFASGISYWGGWVSFSFGFALVLLVLADWPEPLIFDQDGLLERGSPKSRIRWEDLRQVYEYRMRSDRFVVIHSIGGKRLVVAGMAYDSASIVDHLLEHCPVPFHSVDDLTPISILQGPR